MTYLEKATRLEAEDPVESRRDRFHNPRGTNDQEVVYFCGNSLGLMPKEAEGEEIFVGAKFTLATLADGKTSIYSQQRNKYCQDKGGKQECSFPGTISPHAKYEFVKVDDPANLYTSCQSAE